MEIKKENVIAAYNSAKESGDDRTCTMLEQLFGIETFRPFDIKERIKTFEDACAALGNHALVNQYRCIAEEQNPPMDGTATDLIAYLKLRIITAALNEGWEPQFTEDEDRWYPWFVLWTEDELSGKSEEWKRDHCLITMHYHCLTTMHYHRGEWAGLASANSHSAPSYSLAYIGSRLCFKSDTLAEYAGKQFIQLWMDFYLIRK